jgi:hypothetical protein
MKMSHLAPLALILGFPALASLAAAEVTFEKIVLTNEYWCDGITAGDINRDGKMDIVAGPFWYAGPDFKTRHAFYEPVPQPLEASPSNSLFSFVRDFNGDGAPDILVLGRVLHHQAFWYENPGPAALKEGKDAPWKKHFAVERVFGESPDFVDLYGDGHPVIVAHWEKRWGGWAPDPSDATKPWIFTPVSEAADFLQTGEPKGQPHYYHGTGVGDVNDDGRLDLVINDGWWEQPAKRTDPWKWHVNRFSQGKGGAQIYAYDVNGDRKNDVITSLNAHGWGLAWFEQAKGADGARTFIEHPVMGDRSEEAKYGVAFSQPHALVLADLDGDKLPDVIVGKRRWAHGPKGDVEPMEKPVIYWFQTKRDGKGNATLVPHLIDDASGVGTQINAIDVNGDGAPDVLSASKLGAFVFITKRK